jgi:hypothetical protein
MLWKTRHAVVRDHALKQTVNFIDKCVCLFFERLFLLVIARLLVLGIDRLFVLLNRCMNDQLSPPHSGLGEKHRQPRPLAFALDDLAVRLPLTEDAPNYEIADHRVEFRLRGVDFRAKHPLQCGPGNVFLVLGFLMVRQILSCGIPRAHITFTVFRCSAVGMNCGRPLHPFFPDMSLSFSNGYKNPQTFNRPLRLKRCANSRFCLAAVAIKLVANLTSAPFYLSAWYIRYLTVVFSNSQILSPEIRIFTP